MYPCVSSLRAIAISLCFLEGKMGGKGTDKRSTANVDGLIVNMKFTIDWCVFAYPNNENLTVAHDRCSNVCNGPNNTAKTALIDRLLQTNATIQYQYCADENGAFSRIADDCAACLEKIPSAKTMSNCESHFLHERISFSNSVIQMSEP